MHGNLTRRRQVAPHYIASPIISKDISDHSSGTNITQSERMVAVTQKVPGKWSKVGQSGKPIQETRRYSEMLPEDVL